MRTTPTFAALLITALLVPRLAQADESEDATAPGKPSLHLQRVDRSADARTPATPLPDETAASRSGSGQDGGAPSATPGLVGALTGLEGTPPNGPVLGPDLSKIDEDRDLLPGDRAALRAVGPSPGGFRADLEPLILVHGIEGDPKNLQTVADRLASGPFQQYVVCYDDFHRRTSQNGVDLAEELRRLATNLGPGRDVTIVAHSMGGIVVRRALNELAFGPDRGIEKLGRVRVIGIDNPWSGYPGPSDRGIDGFFMKVARAFLPAGLDDMRARSAMFQGDPGAKNPAAQTGLLDPLLPDNVELELVFAKEGTTVLDYAKGDLRALAGTLADHFVNDTPVAGDPMVLNEWRALISSKQYFAFQDDARGLADEGKLDAAAVEAALERHFPQFPGDHMGVLQPHPGETSLLDHLAEELLGVKAPGPGK